MELGVELRVKGFEKTLEERFNLSGSLVSILINGYRRQTYLSRACRRHLVFRCGFFFQREQRKLTGRLQWKSLYEKQTLMIRQ